MTTQKTAEEILAEIYGELEAGTPATGQGPDQSAQALLDQIRQEIASGGSSTPEVPTLGPPQARGAAPVLPPGAATPGGIGPTFIDAPDPTGPRLATPSGQEGIDALVRDLLTPADPESFLGKAPFGPNLEQLEDIFSLAMTPVDAFQEMLVQTARSPTGIPEDTSFAERTGAFRERPWYEQLGIGLALDPGVAALAGVPQAAFRGARGAVRGLRRALPAGQEVVEETAEAGVQRADDLIRQADRPELVEEARPELVEEARPELVEEAIPESPVEEAGMGRDLDTILQNQRQQRIQNIGPETEPFFMDRQQFDDVLDRTISEEANIDATILGEQGAKEYNRLQRIYNSSTASPDRIREAERRIGEIEDALTPEQYARLTGTGETGPTVEFLNSFRREFDDLSDADASFLIRRVGENLHRVDPERLAAFTSRQDILSDAEQLAAIRVRNSVDELTRRGMTREQIFQEAGQSLSQRVEPEDAQFLLQRWMQLGQQAPPTQRGALQAGIGIGESASGGPQTGATRQPLADPAQIEAQAAREELARGQTEEALSPLEQARLRLDEAIILRDTPTGGGPAPKFGTQQASEGRFVSGPERQQRVREARAEVARLEADESQLHQQGTISRHLAESAPARQVDQTVVRPIESEIVQERLSLLQPTEVAEAASKRPIGNPLGFDMPNPRQTHIGLEDDLDIPTFETPVRGIFRKWTGARNAEGLRMERFFSDGNRKLRQAGTRQFNKETMMPVFRALHGEGPVEDIPESLRFVLDDWGPLRTEETDEMVNFLMDVQDEGSRGLANVEAERLIDSFMNQDYYFDRHWKQVKGPTETPARGRLGARAGFTKPRVDATFTEMIDAGWEPASWNPYVMMARRRIAGVEYREQIKLINRLFKQGMALPFDEAPHVPAAMPGLIPKVARTLEPLGGVARELGFGLPPTTRPMTRPWRIPRVGSIFEGKIIPGQVAGSEQLLRTKPIAVPAEMADILEDAYGADVGLLNAVRQLRRWSNIPKRFKLFGSLFQHIDIGSRALGVGFTPTGISRGAPFKTPSMMGRMLNLQFNPHAREALAKKILSPTPLYEGGPSYKMIVEEGWGVRGDLSIINRGFTDLVNETLQDSKTPLALGRKAMRFWEEGLFDGFYRESQRWALDELVLPWLRRTRPGATPRQVAAEAAETVNLIFSTVENWQTVFQNPAFREFVRSVMFSANESEALLRTSIRALGKHPQAGVFREWWLGWLIATAGIANGINYAATGEPLPLASYNPVNLNDPYAFTKVGYNNKFLSPQMPGITGRNGVPIYADLVGQMDTVFRWATDPFAALGARLNVPYRAVINQITEQNFMGEPLDSTTKSLVQLAIDMGLPITGGNLLDMVREQVPEAVQNEITQQEPRIGVGGQLLQTTGLNLRSTTSPELTDDKALELYGKPYFELTSAQKVKVKKELPGNVQAELKVRGEETQRRLFGRPKNE